MLNLTVLRCLDPTVANILITASPPASPPHTIWARGGIPWLAIRLRHLPHAICANAAFPAIGYSFYAISPTALTDPPSEVLRG
ncbi:hypothetical protein GUJ93_ZPchr0003g17963 [Zizania palustris]|uniref:Uncharacterized protein n=1 Tax=Zizania palustris TaxID=103762 RepID=A0A8J5STI4_ZIZPA|nr:hypothetical protein GUJ93_ZPchr0003g17963 [Zizania palustris]